MLMRIQRRLSNGKLYFVFLMQKSLSQIKSTKEALYLITLRDCSNVNELYDLEISLDMARKIFGSKDSNIGLGDDKYRSLNSILSDAKKALQKHS